MTLRFRVVAWIVIALVWLARWRVRSSGVDHVPRSGGAVITWNHHSHVDFVLTAWAVYFGAGRPVRHLAMRELWGHPWLGWVPRFADAIPVTRGDGTDRERALEDAVAALREGHLVLVAPEGGISESFEVRPFRTGAARMAQRAGVPVVPSVSWGTHRLSTTGHRATWRQVWRLPVEVAFGAPIHVAPDDDPVEVTRALHARTGQLLAEVQDVYPDGAPAGAWWVPQRLGGGAPAPDHDAPSVRLRPEDVA